MAYIGRQLARGENKLFDDISSSFNGSTATFNLTVSSVATATATPYQLFVSLGGVMQKPNTDFTTAGNQITFTTAPVAGLSCWIMMQGDTIDQAAIPDASVTPSKISGSNFAFSGDLRLKDADGSHYVGFASPTTVSTNKVWTLPAADGSASQYLQTNGSGVLTWASVTIGGATGIDFNDNVKTRWGTGNDLEVFHNGSHSVINDAGTGDLLLQVGGSTKATVSSTGFDITGALTVSTNATITGNLTVSGTTTTINTQTLDVEDKNVVIGKVSSPSDTTADGGGWTLKGATDKTFNWVNATDAWTSSEHIHLIDNKKLLVGGASGTADGLEIFHDGSTSTIKDSGTGNLNFQGSHFDFINAAGNEYIARLYNDGACELYHNNVKKIETTTGGINVTGAIQVNGAALSSAPEITATATGALAIEEACVVRADGTIEKITGQNEAVGSAVEFHSGSGAYIAPMRVVYNPDKNNNVIFYIKGTGSNSQYPSAYCRSVTISGTTVSYGTQRMIPTDGSSSGEIGGYFGYRGLDCCYDTTNDRFMLTYINKDWGRVHTAVGYANSAGDDFTWGAGYRLMGNPDTQGTRNLRCCFNPDNSRVALFWTNTNNHVWMAQGKYDNDNADWDWTTSSTQVTSVSSLGMVDVDYDTNLDRYLAVWRHSSGSNQVYSRSFNNTLGGASNTVTAAGGEVSTHACVFVPGANKFVEVYATNSDTWKLIAKVGTISSSGSNDPSWGSEVFIQGSTDTNNSGISAVLDSTNNKVIATWYNGTQSKRYASVGTISGTVTTWTPRFEVLVGNGDSAVGYNANAQKSVIAVRDGVNDYGGDAAAYVPGATNLTTENFIGFAKAAISNGATGTVKVVGNTATKSSLTPGQKYYVQFDGSIGTTAVTGTEVEAGIALSSTKLLIKGG